jgi:UDP-N-acetylmuramoyl-tripeptide--D-alanyl-D-alanine ligase
MKLSIGDIANATGGQVLQEQATSFDSFGIDSRNMKPGSLFFALKGEVTDGHLFVEAARQSGAAGAIVAHPVETHVPITMVQVQDPLRALHDLASFVRSRSGAEFIGITGSSGKTSTKEFAASLLSRKFRVFKSEGNLNSITGMPLSLLSMNEPECAVFEVGMNQPGEIKSLSQLLKPHIGILLNVNPVHIGQFPSLEAVADEKYSLVEGIAEEGVLIFNTDDPLLRERAAGYTGYKVSYGFNSDADLRISDAESLGVRGNRGSFVWQDNALLFETKLCGRGNIYNIAAVTALALTLELSWDEVRSEITELQPYMQRGILLTIDGFAVYDDSYNSNPRALDMALQLIAESRGYKRKVAVLGDMLELGSGEVSFHQKAGEAVAANHFDVLITAGPLSRYTAESAGKGNAVYATDNSEEAAEKAAEIVQEGDLVLVKGSRGMKMDKVIERLKKGHR